MQGGLSSAAAPAPAVEARSAAVISPAAGVGASSAYVPPARARSSTVAASGEGALHMAPHPAARVCIRPPAFASKPGSSEPTLAPVAAPGAQVPVLTPVAASVTGTCALDRVPASRARRHIYPGECMAKESGQLSRITVPPAAKKSVKPNCTAVSSAAKEFLQPPGGAVPSATTWRVQSPFPMDRGLGQGNILAPLKWILSCSAVSPTVNERVQTPEAEPGTHSADPPLPD